MTSSVNLTTKPLSHPHRLVERRVEQNNDISDVPTYHSDIYISHMAGYFICHSYIRRHYSVVTSGVGRSKLKGPCSQT